LSDGPESIERRFRKGRLTAAQQFEDGGRKRRIGIDESEAPDAVGLSGFTF